MKSLNQIIILSAVVILSLAACNKVDDLPFYDNGTPVTLTASRTSVIPAVSDSSRVILQLNWTDPKYANDSSTTKYIVEIDSAGRNFSQKVTRELTGKRSISFTGGELYDILLNYGVSVGAAYKLDVRVISSYQNNNERYVSNVETITVTAYSDPSVFSSTATTVNGTIATASQNALTFNWTRSFRGYSGPVTYSIQYDSAGKNFSSPNSILIGTGVLRRVMKVSEINETALNEGIAAGATGKIVYRVRAVTALGAVAISNAITVTVKTYNPRVIVTYAFPKALWVAGNYQGWDPASAPQIVDPAATGTTGSYEGYINFDDPNPEFKLVKGNNWGAGDFGSAGTGVLGNGGPNIQLTSGAGVYLFKANTQDMTWSATKINTWGIIGSATPAGWGGSTPMTLRADGAYSITTTLSAGELKFRANDDWAINFGDGNSGANLDNVPEYNGGNIPIPVAGTYLITLDLSKGGNYYYTITKQ